MKAKLKRQSETGGAADQDFKLLSETEREECMLTVIRGILYMYAKKIRNTPSKRLTSKPGVPGAPYKHSI